MTEAATAVLQRLADDELARVALIAAALPSSFTHAVGLDWESRQWTVAEVLAAADAVDECVAVHDRPWGSEDSASIARRIAALVDRYHRTADGDQRARITNLAGLLRHATAYTAALTTEIEHYAADAAQARDERDELAVRVQELQAADDEWAELCGDLKAKLDGLTADPLRDQHINDEAERAAQ